MTDFNFSTPDQHCVHDFETDAELSLDQLAEINGSGFFDFMIKATKIATATTGTASLPFKLFNKAHKFVRYEVVPTLAWKLKWRI